MAMATAAELLGASLLGEVQEESVQELLKQLRHTLQPQPRDVLGFKRIDRLLELFRFPSISSSPAGQPAWATETETETEPIDHNYDHNTPKSRPAIIQLTSLSSSSFQSSPGKTSLLYHLTALCLLPPGHGGKGSAAVWIDTDGRFSALHLSRVMTSILSGSDQDHHRDTTATHLSTTQETESTISSSLAHLHVIKPTTSSALLRSLIQLPALLLNSSTSHNRTLGLTILDSANAFYHQDRLVSDLARLSSYPGTAAPTAVTAAAVASSESTPASLSPPPTSESIITALKTIQSTFDCTLAFTTTMGPSSPSSTRRSFSVPYDELTTNPWTSFATLTLHLTRLPIPKFPHSMTLNDCLRDRTRRQQAMAKGRVKVYVDIDATDPASREQLRRMAAAEFIIRVGTEGVEVEEER